MISNFIFQKMLVSAAILPGDFDLGKRVSGWSILVHFFGTFVTKHQGNFAKNKVKSSGRGNRPFGALGTGAMALLCKKRGFCNAGKRSYFGQLGAISDSQKTPWDCVIDNKHYFFNPKSAASLITNIDFRGEKSCRH